MTKRKNEPVYQWLEIGLLLTFLGGFLDAYTYVSRGGVFANAQTGNIILLVIEAAQFKASAIRYLLPIAFFIIGVVCSEVFMRRDKHGGFFGHAFILLTELVMLIAVGCMPQSVPDAVVNATVSFVAAIQFNSFRKIDGLPFATAFCTGNLRSMTEYLYRAVTDRDKSRAVGACKYFIVILAFALGVLCGSYLTSLFSGYSAFFMCGLLTVLIAYIFIIHAVRKKNGGYGSNAQQPVADGGDIDKNSDTAQSPPQNETVQYPPDLHSQNLSDAETCAEACAVGDGDDS